jgi:hypothetical protein
MIRVIILLVFLFLLWVLYASGFEKARKIQVSIVSFVLCALVFWYDGYDKRQIKNYVDIIDIEECGLTAAHSYRTNFDLSICVKNNAKEGTINRIKFAVLVSRCDSPDCTEQQHTELQRVERSRLATISPGSKITLDENLSFDQVSPPYGNLRWSIEVLETKARR